MAAAVLTADPCVRLQPREIRDIKQFLEYARRPDAKCQSLHSGGDSGRYQQ